MMKKSNYSEVRASLDIVNGALAVSEGQSAVLESIYWWLQTPIGSVWGNPAFGNKLAMFKHDPIGNQLEVAIEAHIFDKMSKDLPLVKIEAIRVIALKTNEYLLKIMANGELVQTSFDRTKQ